MAAEKNFLLFTVFVTFCITTSYAQTSATASFSVNPVNNDALAIFFCRVYNLGSYTVDIERTIFSRTEPLVSGTSILPDVDDNFFFSTFDNNDGSKSISLTIRGVYNRFDAGSYTCKIMSGSSIVTQSSAVLNINYTPESPDPRCSIVGSSSSDLTRTSGSEVRLACHSEIGYPAVDIAWSFQGCNSGRTLPQPSLDDQGAYYSELRVTLTGDDNGGMFICTISRPDGSFSRSCSKGPFVVTGGLSSCGSGNPQPVPPQVTSPPQPPPQPTQPVINPSITAYFQSSQVDEGTTGILICRVSNLGSNFVSIERRVSSTIEPLALGTNALANAPNNIFLSSQNNNDGSQTYTLTIRLVSRQTDAGTYTCKVESSQRQVLAMQSAVLQINAIAPPPANNPSLTASFQSSPIDEGITGSFICQVYDLGANFVSIERRISSTTEALAVGTNVLPNVDDNIVLSLRSNNDGSQTYTLAIRQVSRQQDAGTYTCKVETYQRIVLVMKSAVLQINAVAVAPTSATIPSMTASFQRSSLDEGTTAIFTCQVSNLGSNYVSIERRTSTTTEPLTLGTTVLPSVADNVFLSSRNNNDGSQTYTLTIRYVNRPMDAGTYTCQVVTSQRQVLVMQSSVLQINVVTVAPTPAANGPYVTASFPTNPVNEGSRASLICNVYNLGSNFVSIERSISSTTQSLTLGTQVLPGFTNDLTLSVRNNNDGSQTYTLILSNAMPQRDAGVYTCKVENYQRQVLDMRVAVLQINMIAMPPTSPYSGSNDPYVTASFQASSVSEGNTAILACQIYNLGSNSFVSIERTTSSKTESVSASTQVFPDFANRAVLSIRDSPGGSKTYTLTISRLSQMDAGSYICKIETFSRQVLAMRSALLTINSVNGPVVTSAPSNPDGSGPNGMRVTATFQVNPIDEERTAILICRAYNLGSNFVSIERNIFSRTEQISIADKILQKVDDNVYISVQDNNDASKSYVLTIRNAHHSFDAGAYTCKIESPQRLVLAQQSAMLNINYDPQLADPRCSILGSSPDLTKLPGSEIKLGCHSELGYPPVNIAWTYHGCDTGRNLPQPTGTSSGAHYSEIKVTLSEQDNGGYFVCTISRPDGSFSDMCSRGPFVIPNGQTCNVKGPTGDRREKNSSSVVVSSRVLYVFSLMMSFCVIYLNLT